VNVLTVDIGGTNIKFLASAESEAARDLPDVWPKS